MNLINSIKHIPRVVVRTASKNAPAILTGVGIASVFGAVTLGCRASWKAHQVYTEMGMEKIYIAEEKRSEYLKRVAPAFAPVAVLSVGSIVCFVAAHKINVKKQTAMLTAYSALSETAQMYQDKVIERLGDEKHEEIMQEIAKDELLGNFPSSYEEECFADEVIKGHGDVLCYDKVTGRYFYTTLAQLKEAQSIVMKMVANELSATVNDFYEALGIPDFSYIGNAIGWDMMRCQPDFFEGSMLDENKRPCMVLMYSTTVINPHELGSTRTCY